jgi:hypothetical protein
MTTNAYFSLANSEGETSYKFRSLLAGHEPLLEKTQNIQPTLNGGLDVSMGGIYTTHTYNVMVRETESEEGFGNKSDLEAFYLLNNPNGTPSNVITLTDHYGNDHAVFMVGQHLPLPLGVVIEGPNAYFVCKCMFKFIPEAE